MILLNSENFYTAIKDFKSEELINLSNKRCNLDCNGENNILNKISFYFYELIQIFTRRGRLLYIGICILFISFMLYFIEISK